MGEWFLQNSLTLQNPGLSIPWQRWKLPPEHGHATLQAGEAKVKDPWHSSIMLTQAFLCTNPG